MKGAIHCGLCPVRLLLLAILVLFGLTPGAQADYPLESSTRDERVEAGGAIVDTQRADTRVQGSM